MIVAHDEDPLCAGMKGDVEWFQKELAAFFGISATFFRKHLSRILRCTDNGVEHESDPKHWQTLLKEWCMNEGVQFVCAQFD